ncbi:MAG TPA: HAD family hydrolase, partial [Leptospiraceae bacterium]|nr:HAD family hydrolase [Leptospiraceae bacterium]
MKIWESGKEKEFEVTLTDKINKYFTISVLSIAFLAGLYWSFTDISKALNAMTAVLIVACPCGLLLTTTFVNGNLLRILGRNEFYLKNSSVIDKLTKTDTVIFDKTGTITNGSEISFVGRELTNNELKAAVSLASHSSHPLSRKIYTQFNKGENYILSDFTELPGRGIKGRIDGNYIMLGSKSFVMGVSDNNSNSSNVFFSINSEVIGCFKFINLYRNGLTALISRLSNTHQVNLLSGD